MKTADRIFFKIFSNKLFRKCLVDTGNQNITFRVPYQGSSIEVEVSMPFQHSKISPVDLEALYRCSLQMLSCTQLEYTSFCFTGPQVCFHFSQMHCKYTVFNSYFPSFSHVLNLLFPNNFFVSTKNKPSFFTLNKKNYSNNTQSRCVKLIKSKKKKRSHMTFFRPYPLIHFILFRYELVLLVVQ